MNKYLEAINAKIIFMGTPTFAADILGKLLKNGYNITSVFTQPDKKIGRKQEISFSPVKQLAHENNIRLFQPDSLKKREVEKILRGIAPDLIIVAAYGKILPQEILTIPRFGCLNVHASLLPKFRGASPIQNAILAGENETGVTLMLMSEKMDAGDILAQKKLKISDVDTTETLTPELSRLGAKVLLENISQWISGKIKTERQNEKMATYCHLIKRENGLVDWKKSAQEILDQWRAFQPWPGLYAIAKLKQATKGIKLVEIEIDPAAESGEKIGKIIKYDQRTAVQTEKGMVFLKKVQLEGKKALRIDDFQRGYPDFTMTG